MAIAEAPARPAKRHSVQRVLRRPAGPRARNDRRGRALLAFLPMPVALVLVGLVMPSELSLFVGPLRIPPHRLALLIFFLAAVVRYFQVQPIRLTHFDILFALFNAWSLLTYILHLGLADGLEYGGALALESFGAYFVARVYIRDVETFRAALAFLFILVLVVALMALPELPTGRHFVHEVLHAVTGYYHPVAYHERLGLTRAYATFDHPILYGTFCASLLGLVWFGERRRTARYLKAAIVAAAAFFGLSSAPMLALLAQVGLIVWERLTRGLVHRISIALVIAACGYLVVEVLSSRSAIEAIVTRITLDPWTAYYRIFIWEHGLQVVAANPLFGIGLSDWSRAWWMKSDSVDAYWLVTMMRTGIPSVVLLLAALTMLMLGVRRFFARLPLDARRLAVGWIISLVALGLTALTVHYWNTLHGYMFFMIGAGAWLADPRPRDRRPVAPSDAASPRRFPRGATPMNEPAPARCPDDAGT